MIFFLLTQTSRAAEFKPILNLLAPIGILSPKIISQFEEQTKTHIRVEFVGSRFEFESRLRAGLRSYDVVIADERVLQRLFLSRLLRSLNDEIVSLSSNNPSLPLQMRSRLNVDGRSYLTLLVDPMGIVFNKKKFPLKVEQPSWNWLISPDKIPFWRQRVYVSNIPKQQLLIALLATGKELSASSWFIPEPTMKWLQKLKLQSANIDYPLELAFLGNKIEAATVFRSDYLKIKKVVLDLKFVVPNDITYYDRLGIGIVSDTAQEVLAQNFIKFLYKNKNSLINNENYLLTNIVKYDGQDVKNWILYDDELPLSKRIENILNDFYKK